MSYCRTSQPDSDIYVIGTLDNLECFGSGIKELNQPDHKTGINKDWGWVNGQLIELDTTHEFSMIWRTTSRLDLVEHLQKHREHGHRVPDDVFERLLEEINELGDTYTQDGWER